MDPAALVMRTESTEEEGTFKRRCGERRRLVYLRCIPTVVQAARKKGEQRGELKGRGCCSLEAGGENDATAVLGGCRQRGWRDAGRGGGGGGGEGALAHSALSDVAFSGSKPIRRLTAVLPAPK